MHWKMTISHMISAAALGMLALTAAAPAGASAMLNYDFAVDGGITPTGFGNNLDLNALGEGNAGTSIMTADGTGLAGNGAVKVTITSGPLSLDPDPQVHLGSNGIGVNSFANEALPDDQRIGETTTGAEQLTLIFDTEIRLLMLTFDGVDFNDTFGLEVDGNTVIASQLIGGSVAPVDVLIDEVGTAFTIFGLDPTNNDLGTFNQVGFRLVGAMVEVPEPGTLALFGIGLAGLAAARRRRTY